MSLRDDLAAVLARDARYALSAYIFVFEALEHSKNLKKQARTKRGRGSPGARHVTPRELCAGARDLALRRYGYLALVVLNQWGLRSTADLGEIVFNLIASGDLEKTATDSRADFEGVFDFETAFRTSFAIKAATSARAEPTEPT